MAVPSDPTVASVIRDGMVEAGQYTLSVSSQAVTDFTARQFQTIKTEVWAASNHDDLLETEACLIAGLGNSAVTLPADFDHETQVWVYDASEPYRGTAQAGGAATITLATAFSEDPTALFGRFVFILSGTGSGQHRQIIAYNNATKVLTVHTNWTTNPDSTSAYLIGVLVRKLIRRDTIRVEQPTYRPTWYSLVGTSLLVWPAGDQLYPLVLRYIPNLTRLDEAGTVFVKHLRERRWLWIAGVKYLTGVRYNEARAPEWRDEWYKLHLPRYASLNLVSDQLAIHR